MLFDTDNLHETPEFGHRAKLAWIRAKRGAGGGTDGPFKPCGFSYRLRLSPPERRFWCKLGWISFGVTAAHIAIMHDEVVEKKRWISNQSFLHALSHYMILPGPEAQQLAIYIGWKLHGKRGGIVAGV